MGNTQSRIFAEIRDNSTESSINNSYQVSEKTGLLAICKVNQVRTVILFEYLQRCDGKLQRSVIQIDFGPGDKRSCIAGKGNTQHQEFVGENEILANIRNLKVGKNWLCNTEKVLRTFAAIRNEVYDCTNIATKSSSANRTEVYNSLTSAVDLLYRKANDLGIICDKPQMLRNLPHPDLWVTAWTKRNQSFKV